MNRMLKRLRDALLLVEGDDASAAMSELKATRDALRAARAELRVWRALGGRLEAMANNLRSELEQVERREGRR